MKQSLCLVLEDVDVFDTLDFEKAGEVAGRTNGRVYSWKTVGKSNWLERGYRQVDTLAFVVLPSEFPESIELPDDEPEESVDDEDMCCESDAEIV